MANESGDLYVLSVVDLESLNEILRRIGERFDKLEGLRGEVTTYDTIKTASDIKKVDSNGTTIHSFGTE